MMKGVKRRKGLKTWPVPGILLMLTASFFLSACAVKQQQGTGDEISVLYQKTICRADASKPLVAWFDRRADLRSLDNREAFFEGLDESVIADFMALDFNRNGILMLSPGNRWAKQYDILLGSQILDIADDTALIQLKFLEKENGETREIPESCTPSIFLKVPRGEYDHIQAWDEDGSFMVKIRLPEI